MEDRTEELRNLAGQCLTLASTATDPQVRASLVLMARRFHDLAARHHSAMKTLGQQSSEAAASDKPVLGSRFGEGNGAT